MARVIVTAPADHDTADILDHLNREAGHTIAAKYDRLFGRLYQRLEAHPDSDSRRPRLGADIRISPVLPYIIVYKHIPTRDAVVIIRILHGSRRITTMLLRQGS